MMPSPSSLLWAKAATTFARLPRRPYFGHCGSPPAVTTSQGKSSGRRLGGGRFVSSWGASPPDITKTENARGASSPN